MQPEVEQTLTWAECDDVWLPADRDRWRLRLDVDDDPALVLPGVRRAFGG